MTTLARQKVWVTGDVLTASDLNGEFNNIVNDYNGSVLSVNIGTLTNTLTQTVSTNVDLLALTKSGTGAGSVIDASDAGTDPMVDLQKTGAGTALYINQDAEGISIDIDSEQTTTDVINISPATLTTANVIDIPDADSLTTGGVIDIVSNSSSTSTRELVHIENNHSSATGTTCVVITADAAAYALLIGTN